MYPARDEIFESIIIHMKDYIGYIRVSTVKQGTKGVSLQEQKDAILRYAERNQLYTEEPVYSFHSGIPMPPDLAVLVLKRYWAGEMTDARLTEDLKSFKPELMLLRNDSNPRPFRNLIGAQYQLIYMDGENLLYVLKSIVRPVIH